MSDWWIENAYFKYRAPVVAWSSPGLVFPHVEFKDQTEQLTYASKLISAALDYKQLIDKFVQIMCFMHA